MRKIISIGLAIGILYFPSGVSALTAAQWQTLYGSTEYYTGPGSGATGNSGGGSGSGSGGGSGTTCTTTSTGSSSTASNNLDYAGRPILNAAELQAIAQNEPVYQQVANQTHIPWEILAAIHYRENTLSIVNPDNGQGVYGNTQPGNNWTPNSSSDFLAETTQAANYLLNNTPALKNSTDSDTIKQALFDYNGAAQVYVQQALSLGFTQAQADIGEGSPYVMNFADATRDPTVNTTTWGQVKQDNGPIVYPADQTYGAYIVYADLAGIDLAGGTSGLSATRQNVVCLSQQQLADWSAPGFDIATGFLPYTKDSLSAYEEWCADFVSWIYDQANYPLQPDPNWDISAVAGVQQVGENGGNFTWHASNGNYTPVPGDMAIHWDPPYEHVNIVVGVSGTTLSLIGGDQGNPQEFIDGKDQTNYGTENPPSTSLVSTETVTGFSSDSIIGYVSPTN